MTLDEPEKMQVLKSKSRTPNYIKDWTLQITEDEKTGHTQAHNMPTIRLFPILTMETIKSTLFIHIHFGHFGLLIRLKRLISRWSNFPWPISLGQSLITEPSHPFIVCVHGSRLPAYVTERLHRMYHGKWN